MRKETAIHYCDLGIELSLNILIFILPFRHTATVRSFCIIFPLFLWMLKMILEKRLIFSKTGLELPVIASLIWTLISLVWAKDFMYSLNEIRGEMTTYFLLFFLIVNNFQDEQKIKGLIKTLSLGVFTMSFYGIMWFLQKENSSLTDIIKMNSLTVDLGVYLVLTVPVIATLYKVYDGVKEKFFLFLIIILSISSLYLSHNRAAWMAFGFQIILYTIMEKRWKVLFTVTALIILALFSPIQKKIHVRDILTHEITIVSPQGQIEKKETFQTRMMIWREGLDKISEYPIAGIGYGRESFKRAFPDNPIMIEDKGLWHTHNIFMEIALETGIPGLIIFIWLLYSLTKTIIKGMKSMGGFGKVFMTSLFITLTGFLIRNQFDYIYVDDTALMFWLLMSMGTAMVLKDRDIMRHRD